MKYLKKFNNHQNYEVFTQSEDYIEPNVSFCETEDEIHYNPYIPPFFCKLTLNNDNVIELEGEGTLTSTMINSYRNTCVGAEIGKLCTSIDSYAFEDCTNLTSVIIGNNVTNIGSESFKNCSLTEIFIPSSVTNIAQDSFAGCSDLSSMIVDQNNTEYDSRNNCNAIIKTDNNTLISGCKNTIIPNDIVCIGSESFAGQKNLTSIIIPNSVTKIDSVAFSRCSGLTNLTIGSGVTKIETYAFQNCTSLTNIISLPSTAPTIASSTFYGVKTNGTLTISHGSTGYDVWMGTGNYYLGKYNWTEAVNSDGGSND